MCDCVFFFFKQKTAYEMRISDWSSDVCSSDLQRLRELAGERRRFGYRRLGILLAREGMGLNHKKLLRLYREEGLAVPPGARHQAVPDRPRQLRSAAQGALDRQIGRAHV